MVVHVPSARTPVGDDAETKVERRTRLMGTPARPDSPWLGLGGLNQSGFDRVSV